MTAQLSRERIEQYANDPRMCNVNEEIRTMARMLLAGMDSDPVALQNFRSAMEGIGHIRRTLDETFGGLHGTHCEPDVLVECKAICDAICEAYRQTAQPVQVPDASYQMPSDLYHAQEKRLFKLAQRIKGPAFDKYAHSPSQAIDVMEAALFGEGTADSSAMLSAQQPEVKNV